MLTPITKTMTKKLITVPMGTTLKTASNLMMEKRIRHLPVTDELDDIVGMISDRDIHRLADSKTLPVEMLMTSPVVAVNQSTPVRRATLKMLQEKISSVLVVDDNEVVLGIVTTDDLLWHLAHLLSDEESGQPSKFVNYLQTMGQVSQKLADIGI